MKQISLPFSLRPLLLACGIFVAANPAFAGNTPSSPAAALSNLILTQDAPLGPSMCLSGESQPTVLVRVTSALTIASLKQAEPGFVLIDDLDSAPNAVKVGASLELVARTSGPAEPVPPKVSSDVVAKPTATSSKPGTFALLADLPREWADKAKVLTSHISEKFNVDESFASKIVKAVIRSGDQTGISPTLLLAVIAEESSFNASARNGNARGLMQIIPFWHQKKVNLVGGPKELMKSEKNIAVGSAILKEYLDRSDNVFQALARYNASAKAQAYSKKVLKRQQSFDAVASPEIR